MSVSFRTTFPNLVPAARTLASVIEVLVDELHIGQQTRSIGTPIPSLLFLLTSLAALPISLKAGIGIAGTTAFSASVEDIFNYSVSKTRSDATKHKVQVAWRVTMALGGKVCYCGVNANLLEVRKVKGR